MIGLFTDFGRLEIKKTTSGSIDHPVLDLFIDDEFIREISSEDDLNFYEKHLLLQDKAAIYLSSFPGNIIGTFVVKIKQSYQKVMDTVDHINGM